MQRRSEALKADAEFSGLLDSCERQRVMVLGDTIVDEYVYGTAIGKSAETPTIVARAQKSTRTLGGAFLVVRNLLELGASVDLVTAVGPDEPGTAVLAHTHPRYRGAVIVDEGRQTVVKRRFWVDGYKLLQFDTVDDGSASDSTSNRVLQELDQRLDSCDAVVVADYRHGLLASPVAQQIVTTCKQRRKPLYVDSQVSQQKSNLVSYRGADVFVANLLEARCVDAGFDPSRDVSAGFERLRSALGSDVVVVKLGADGAVACSSDRIVAEPALAITPLDTCGAGDAFLAALCLGGVSDLARSLRFANAWAGRSTLVHGTSPASREEWLRSMGPLGQ